MPSEVALVCFVSVQFIVISLNLGICEYPYSVEITKI